MDGLFHEKPYEQMDDLGCKNPYSWFNTHARSTGLPWPYQSNAGLVNAHMVLAPMAG